MNQLLKAVFPILFLLNINLAHSQWSVLSSGTNKRVQAFYIDSINDLLYIGGSFNTAGGININSISTWDGLSWNAIGTNEIFSSPGSIFSIANFNGDIVVAGIFDSIGNTRVNNIARWDGSAWKSIGGGFNSTVHDIIAYKGDLYACGLFRYSDTVDVGTFARWNGNSWEKVVQFSGFGYTMTEHAGELIIGGSIDHPYPSLISGIAGWDGNTLDTTFGYFNNEVLNLYSDGDTLYAVGSFTGYPGNPSKYVSVYYGNTWHSIGAPTGGPNWITDITKYNGKLFLSGYFSNPPDLCSYNGVGFDSAADVAGFISALIVYKNELYIGGQFSQLNGNTMLNVARYNGQNNFVPDYQHDATFTLFPNLCHSGTINFNVKYSESFKKGQLNIYSCDGKYVHSTELVKGYSNEITFNLSLEKGIYIFDFTINSYSRFKRKIVVL